MVGEARFEELCGDLLARHGGLERTKMMGMLSLKLVAGFTAAEGAMVFELPDADAHGRALSLDGAHLFDPGGRGRPMKEWVVVPPAHAAGWPELAAETLA